MAGALEAANVAIGISVCAENLCDHAVFRDLPAEYHADCLAAGATKALNAKIAQRLREENEI